MTLLSQFTPLLDLPVVDPTQSLAFPMNVVSLLPYMLLHFEDANQLCILSAENIAQVFKVPVFIEYISFYTCFVEWP